MGGKAAGEHRRKHVQHQRKAGALPIADRHCALRRLDSRGVAGEVARSVEAPIDRQQRTASAIGSESPVGKLRHRHIENNMSSRRTRTRHSDDQRIVPHGRRSRSPGGHVCQSVAPAHREHSGFGGDPAVGSAAHPVVRARQSNTSDAVLLCQLHRPLRGRERVQVADPAMPIPAFERAQTSSSGGLSVDVDAAILDHRGEARKAVQSMGVDAIASSFGKQSRA
jgi:hypothetical protein